MAQKRYDFFRKFTNNEGNEILYARGILTIEVFGLSKTKSGKLVVPSYRIDEKGNMQSFFSTKEGKPIPLYTYKGDGKEKVVSQSELEGKTKQKNLLLWINTNGTNVWFKLEAWEYIAKRLNMFYNKGQEVVILAHKNTSKGAESGKQEEVWVIDDICKVEKDLVYKKEPKGKVEKEIDEEEKEDFEQIDEDFEQIEDEDDFDLPFK